jgi:hypothetical protein
MFAGRVKVRTKSRRTGFDVWTDGVPSFCSSPCNAVSPDGSADDAGDD